MVDLIEVIVCCCNYENCKVKDKLDCAGNIDGEIYIRDIKKGIEQWLSSFDTSSATKCFEAVNILKMKIAQEEMHEADERLLNSDWGEMEVRE